MYPLASISRRCLNTFRYYPFFFVYACTPGVNTPDLSGLYNELAMHEDPNRNPVIVIPGLLGSKLVDLDTGKLLLIVGMPRRLK